MCESNEIRINMDREFADRLKRENSQQFHTLVRMHLSFELDLTTDEFVLSQHFHYFLYFINQNLLLYFLDVRIMKRIKLQNHGHDSIKRRKVVHQRKRQAPSNRIVP